MPGFAGRFLMCHCIYALLCQMRREDQWVSANNQTVTRRTPGFGRSNVQDTPERCIIASVSTYVCTGPMQGHTYRPRLAAHSHAMYVWRLDAHVAFNAAWCDCRQWRKVGHDQSIVYSPADTLHEPRQRMTADQSNRCADALVPAVVNARLVSSHRAAAMLGSLAVSSQLRNRRDTSASRVSCIDNRFLSSMRALTRPIGAHYGVGSCAPPHAPRPPQSSSRSPSARSPPTLSTKSDASGYSQQGAKNDGDKPVARCVQRGGFVNTGGGDRRNGGDGEQAAIANFVAVGLMPLPAVIAASTGRRVLVGTCGRPMVFPAAPLPIRSLSTLDTCRTDAPPRPR
jgi:hypothetical protein